MGLLEIFYLSRNMSIFWSKIYLEIPHNPVVCEIQNSLLIKKGYTEFYIHNIIFSINSFILYYLK